MVEVETDEPAEGHEALQADRPKRDPPAEQELRNPPSGYKRKRDQKRLENLGRADKVGIRFDAKGVVKRQGSPGPDGVIVVSAQFPEGFRRITACGKAVQVMAEDAGIASPFPLPIGTRDGRQLNQH